MRHARMTSPARAHGEPKPPVLVCRSLSLSAAPRMLAVEGTLSPPPTSARRRATLARLLLVSPARARTDYSRVRRAISSQGFRPPRDRVSGERRPWGQLSQDSFHLAGQHTVRWRQPIPGRALVSYGLRALYLCSTGAPLEPHGGTHRRAARTHAKRCTPRKKG